MFSYCTISAAVRLLLCLFLGEVTSAIVRVCMRIHLFALDLELTESENSQHYLKVS